MKVKSVLLATTLLIGATGFAVAQSSPGMGSGAGASGNVSAATHCKDAAGQIKLKSAANTGGTATTGAGQTGGASSGGKTGAGAPSGSGSGAGATGSAATSGGGSVAATLPNC
jgi:hypothetical protein